MCFYPFHQLNKIKPIKLAFCMLSMVSTPRTLFSSWSFIQTRYYQPVLDNWQYSQFLFRCYKLYQLLSFQYWCNFFNISFFITCGLNFLFLLKWHFWIKRKKSCEMQWNYTVFKISYRFNVRVFTSIYIKNKSDGEKEKIFYDELITI